MVKITELKNMPADNDYVEGVRKANERMQNRIDLEDVATMDACILAGIESKEKAVELEKLGWEYLESGDIKAGFSIFHRLIRREDAPPSVFDGLVTFYEKYNDPANALSCCKRLEASLRKHGREEELPALEKRKKANYDHLSYKAVTYEETGERRFAFNCYGWMIGHDPSNMQAYAGYMRNAIPSGKPEEAYNKIEKEPEFKQIILGDVHLAMMYSNLVRYIEENPQSENTYDQFEVVDEDAPTT